MINGNEEDEPNLLATFLEEYGYNLVIPDIYGIIQDLEIITSTYEVSLYNVGNKISALAYIKRKFPQHFNLLLTTTLSSQLRQYLNLTDKLPVPNFKEFKFDE